MKRHWAVILAATALVGCRGSQPATNPFLRSTVPPPATGEGAVIVPGEPYYPGGAPPGGAAPMGPAPMGAPAPVAPPPLNLRNPPGGDYQYHQSSVGSPSGPGADGAPLAATDDRVDAAAPGALRLSGRSNAVEQAIALGKDPNGVATVSYEQYGGNLPEHAPADVSPGGTGVVAVPNVAISASSAGSPAGASSVRIVESPAGGSVAAVPSTLPAGASTAAGPPLQVTVGEPAVAATKPAGGAAKSDYAFNPDYTALSGKLEYSKAARQWKLRYIPIDGKTDAYGGSVVLSDSAALEQFKPGDHVSVSGKLAAKSGSSGSFSPPYQLDRVERLSP